MSSDNHEPENHFLSLLISEKFSLILIGLGILSIAIVGGLVGSLWALAGVVLFYIGLSESPLVS